MRHDLLDEALTAIRAAGCRPEVVRNRHFKIRWTDRRGRRRCLVVAFTPSDHRARLKSRAVLRRLLTS
jgi:hypothetical protein